MKVIKSFFADESAATAIEYGKSDRLFTRRGRTVERGDEPWRAAVP